jgi:hypothetical protein
VGIGGSIFLLAVGAILAWAVHIQLGWLDLSVVGYVLMVAGLVGLILTIWFWNSRRRRVVTQVGTTRSGMPVGTPVGSERVVEERQVDYPPTDQY